MYDIRKSETAGFEIYIEYGLGLHFFPQLWPPHVVSLKALFCEQMFPELSFCCQYQMKWIAMQDDVNSFPAIKKLFS